jgi:MYXO-CTERM domain-containing protein
VRTKGPGFGTATVQTLIVDDGAQAVQVNRLPHSDDRWGVPVDGYPSINTPYVCIEWSMYVLQSSGGAGTFGPFLGVEAYDDDAAFVGLAGSLGVDASNGEVLIQQQDTGFLTAPGPTVAFGTWNDFQIELNYLNHTYRAFLNGAVIATEGFVDENNIPGGLDEFTDANIAAIAAAGDAGSQALGGTAFFDNFKVTESPIPCDVIPEPASGLLALAGLLGLAMRRRAGFARA